MKSSRFFFWSSFLLLALLMVKISSFHVYTHLGEPDSIVEQCSVCDFSIENQHPEIADGLPIDIVFQTIPATGTLNFEPSVSEDSKYYHLRLFGRPPPSLG